MAASIEPRERWLRQGVQGRGGSLQTTVTWCRSNSVRNSAMRVVIADRERGAAVAPPPNAMNLLRVADTPEVARVPLAATAPVQR